MADDPDEILVDDDSGIGNADEQADGTFLPISLISQGRTIQSCPNQVIEREMICACICTCKHVPASQWCVSLTLWAFDAKLKFESTIKAEVPYDMSKKPPKPYMSLKNKKRATRRRPLGSRIPDAVIVKDGSKPPTQSNIAEVIEIKFPGDRLDPAAERDYLRIAGRAPFTVLTPAACGCPDKPKKVKKAIAAALVVGLVIDLGIIAGLIFAPEVTVPALVDGAIPIAI